MAAETPKAAVTRRPRLPRRPLRSAAVAAPVACRCSAPRPRRPPTRRRSPRRSAAAPARARPTSPRRSRRAAVKKTIGPVFVRAQAKYVRSSPRKARLVVDHIRGKSVDEARAICAHTPRAAAVPVLKVLESAIANAEHNHELLQNRNCSCTRGVSEYRTRLVDRLSADVVHDQARLARRAADVLGLRAHGGQPIVFGRRLLAASSRRRRPTPSGAPRRFFAGFSSASAASSASSAAWAATAAASAATSAASSASACVWAASAWAGGGLGDLGGLLGYLVRSLLVLDHRAWPLVQRPHDHGRFAWARTHRVCARPSAPRRRSGRELAVMHGHRMTNHAGKDRRCPRPGADDPPLVRAIERIDLFLQRASIYGPFLDDLDTKCLLVYFRFVVRRRTIIESVRLLLRVRACTGFPQLAGWRTNRCLALAAAVRMVTRVHRRRRGLRAPPTMPVPTRFSDHDILVIDVADRPRVAMQLR